MDTNSTSRRAAKSIFVIGFLTCLGVVGFAGAVSSASAVRDRFSVDRAHKGDRLPLAPKQTLTFSSPVVTTMPRPPVGCDPAFSRAADPTGAHVFGRCIS